jgi:hypothetical protein
VTLSGDFSIVAGSGNRGNEDGAALGASFCYPNDITVSADGSTLYINDVADGIVKLRRCLPDWPDE